MARVLKVATLNKTVTTAGTRVQLVTDGSVYTPMVMIQADPANTGNAFVGDSGVSSSVFGAVLGAGQSISLEAVLFGSKGGDTAEIDLGTVYVDASVNGSKVSVVYLVDKPLA